MTRLMSGTRHPSQGAKVFTTHQDNQPGVDVKVFEGERALTAHNRLLGDFSLGGIAPPRAAARERTLMSTPTVSCRSTRRTRRPGAVSP